MRKPQFILLMVALTLGSALRVNGLTWGLPDDLRRTYSYHPDESSLIAWATDLYHGAVLDKQFMYGGTFYFSTLAAGNYLAAAMAPTHIASLRQEITVARVFSTLCAVLNIVLVYTIGATLYAPMAGAWAALILALSPGHVLAAQIARPDALFTLLLTVNLLLAARLLRGLGKPRRTLWLAGAVLGVSVATRFPAGVWWFGYTATLAMVVRRNDGDARSLWRQLTQLSAIAASAYVLASPHSVMHFSVLMEGLATQFNYQRGAAASAPMVDITGWRYGGEIMAQALGFGWYPPALAALVWCAWRRQRADLLLVCFMLPYFLLLTTSHWLVVRYCVPLLPVLAIACGRLLADGLTSAGLARAASVAVAICAFSINGVALGAYAAAEREPDPRDQALRWLLSTAPAGSRIGVLQGYDGDVYFHPPAIAHFEWTACVLPACEPAHFFSSSAQWLIVADHYLAPVTADGRRSTVAQALAAQTTFLPVQRFAPSLAHFGYDVAPQFGNADMRHAIPALTVYRHR